MYNKLDKVWAIRQFNFLWKEKNSTKNKELAMVNLA
jgi:hypothetical protein